MEAELESQGRRRRLHQARSVDWVGVSPAGTPHLPTTGPPMDRLTRINPVRGRASTRHKALYTTGAAFTSI
ncbi:hypothetical protein VZT92_019691 [Zoarces viviparus]|uniref:Uncharacterized protein n=1 Tax=Zoarces viviparus TaxID=48416 RepID=A0AAW1EKW9_ZOAVI